jgi:hypothetical protein
MGTVTIAVGWQDLQSDPIYEFERYFKSGLNSKMSKFDREDNKLDKSNNYLIKTGYNKHVYGFIDKKKFLMVSSRPRPFINPLPDFKITWHQSQWKDQEDVAITFVKIFGFENAKAILCNGKVVRIDFWLDTELSYEQARMFTYRSGSSISDQIKSTRRTFYIGAKGNKRALFYEKSQSSISDTDVRVKGKNSKELKYVRYEVRYFNSEVPIRTYAEYFKTVDKDVFRIINVLVFNDEKFKQVARVTKINEKKVIDFLNLVTREGLFYARKKLNENRNFYRTFGMLLNEVGSKVMLDAYWKRKVQNKIIGNFDIIKFFEGEVYER